MGQTQCSRGMCIHTEALVSESGRSSFAIRLEGAVHSPGSMIKLGVSFGIESRAQCRLWIELGGQCRVWIELGGQCQVGIELGGQCQLWIELGGQCQVWDRARWSVSGFG